MKLKIMESSRIVASIERVFDLTLDPAEADSFTGYGPIPGVVSIRELDPVLGSGARREILNRDGSTHREQITAFTRPFCHVAEITGLKPPFAWLVGSMQDRWNFRQEGNDTVLDRSFEIRLKSGFAYPLVAVLARFLRAAMRRHLEVIKQRAALLQTHDPEIG